jgi:ankyrin repeat protein
MVVAAAWKYTHSLVVRLLDEKGADVNGTRRDGSSALHVAASLDILIALLDRGADPTRVNQRTRSPLMQQAFYGTADVVVRLLQDPRVRATVNMQNLDGSTALHLACWNNRVAHEETASKVQSLLEADANPTIAGNDGMTPMDYLRQHRPDHHAAIALLEQTLADAEKAALLVKARRLALAATNSTVVPSCLQARLAGRHPLPVVGLVPLTDGQVDGEDEHGEEDRKLRTTLAIHVRTGAGGHATGRISGCDGPADALLGSPAKMWPMRGRCKIHEEGRERRRRGRGS